MPDTYLLQKFSFLYSADRFHGIAHLQLKMVQESTFQSLSRSR